MSLQATPYCRVTAQGQSSPSKGVTNKKTKPPGRAAGFVGSSCILWAKQGGLLRVGRLGWLGHFLGTRA